MSKYIIDIPDGVEWGVVTCRTEDGFYTRDFDSLEVLNSDYINEHFGDLQQDEYDRGYKDGRNVTETQSHDDAYHLGLDEAWKAARRISVIELNGGLSGKELMKIYGTMDIHKIYDDNTASEAIAKLKAYEQKQDDKPIIGEVVERYLNGKRDGVGMFLGEDGDYWNCLFWTGAIFGIFAYPSNQFKRTGTVCDITKILEAMKA